MSGSFYSKFVFPYLCELTMSGKSLSGFRQDVLQEINGEVLEIGFGTGLNLPQFCQIISFLKTSLDKLYLHQIVFLF